MYSKVTLLGHLTQDVKIKKIYTGQSVAETAIATNKRYKSNDGVEHDEVCFIDIVFWGKIADIAHEYLHTGSKLLVEGRLKFDQWDDKNSGYKRTKHSVVVETMKMLDCKDEHSKRMTQQVNTQKESTIPTASDEEIPF